MRRTVNLNLPVALACRPSTTRRPAPCSTDARSRHVLYNLLTQPLLNFSNLPLTKYFTIVAVTKIIPIKHFNVQYVFMNDHTDRRKSLNLLYLCEVMPSRVDSGDY